MGILDQSQRPEECNKLVGLNQAPPPWGWRPSLHCGWKAGSQKTNMATARRRRNRWCCEDRHRFSLDEETNQTLCAGIFCLPASLSSFLPRALCLEADPNHPQPAALRGMDRLGRFGAPAELWRRPRSGSPQGRLIASTEGHHASAGRCYILSSAGFWNFPSLLPSSPR